jgi:hypothetical protein
VFSIDSIVAAIGMANDIPIMIAAVLIAAGWSHRPLLKTLCSMPIGVAFSPTASKLPYPARLGLVRHGVRRRRGDVQHPDGAAAAAVHPRWTRQISGRRSPM